MFDDDSIDEFDGGRPWVRRFTWLVLCAGCVLLVEKIGTPHVRLVSGHGAASYVGVEGVRTVPANARGVSPLIYFVPLKTPLRERGAGLIAWTWQQIGNHFSNPNEVRDDN